MHLLYLYEANTVCNGVSPQLSPQLCIQGHHIGSLKSAIWDYLQQQKSVNTMKLGSSYCFDDCLDQEPANNSQCATFIWWPKNDF